MKIAGIWEKCEFEKEMYAAIWKNNSVTASSAYEWPS
jgi:hypothetical protein